MAAHAYRAWLFEHQGLTVWNAQWYGGHHVLGYSLLVFVLLAAAFGPGDVGVLRRGGRGRALRPARARGGAVAVTRAWSAAWLLTAGVLSNVAIGRMRSCSGSRWRSARGGRRAAAGACCRRLGLAAMLASPVAGVFLMLGVVAKLIADGRSGVRAAAWVGLPTLAGGIALYLLFPEGGTDRFAATAFWPMLVLSAAGVALLAPGRRTLWAGGLLYLGVLIGAFVVPSPFGQNALRLGVLAGPSVLALAHRRRVPVLRAGRGRRRPAVPAVAAGGAGRRRGARRSRARGSRSRPRRATSSARRQARRARRGAADHEPLGGGRPGQDRAAGARVGAPARPEGEPDLLRRRGADRVEVPRLAARERRPLGRAAERSARLLRARRRRRCSSAARSSSSSSRVAAVADLEVRGTDPPASNGAKVLATGPNWFMVDTSKPTVVRYRYTPYWSAPNACVSRAPGGWTRVEPQAENVVLVQARFGRGAKGGTPCQAGGISL